ncbi:hypothetical protein O181_003740 [Austropuccinia psidii MF-1]|uniref:Uncharacterized protein n=1 Tax=Austropuccinia psidii MF-1 TaxID=1389203 RepID=A0A9Q3BFL0_9BASI|nr:hypothetical protein [Austropuccinia psidii MF-1]
MAAQSKSENRERIKSIPTVDGGRTIKTHSSFHSYGHRRVEKAYKIQKRWVAEIPSTLLSIRSAVRVMGKRFERHEASCWLESSDRDVTDT